MCMNFFVLPHEIRKNNKLPGGVSKNHEKINVSPPFILNLRVVITNFKNADSHQFII